MISESLSQYKRIDMPKESPDTLTMEWLTEHTNMEVALRAYEEGVHLYGPSRPNVVTPEGQEKLRLVREKVAITHTPPATFPLSEEEMHEALCLLPVDWLKHANLQKIEVVPPQYFCFGDMARWSPTFAEHHFICAIIDGDEAEDHFAGKKVPFLREKNLVGPPSRFHYAPGQYMGDKAVIRLWEEPSIVKEQISTEARKEYGRELVVHEALHSVFYDGSPVEFFIDGQWQDYRQLMQQFHEICRAEPVAITEYSELYLPWLRLPLHTQDDEHHWAGDFRIRSVLQEELGELLSAHVRGWGATPQGKAVRPTERDFGGIALQESGVSQKVSFVDKLLRAPVRLKTPEASAVSDVRKTTAEQIDDAQKSN